MKQTLLALLLASTLAQAEVTRIDCPPSAFTGVRTCYSLGVLDEATQGISLTGSSCAKSNPRNTAPLYFMDSYYFTLSKEANLNVELQPRTTNRLRVNIYTPTVEQDGVSALMNGAFPAYSLQQLEAGNYSVTIKGVGTGVGAGVCGYRVNFGSE